MSRTKLGLRLGLEMHKTINRRARRPLQGSGEVALAHAMATSRLIYLLTYLIIYLHETDARPWFWGHVT